MRHLTDIGKPVLRWFLATTWTLLMGVVLLSPSSNPVHNDVSFLSSFFSLSLARHDLFEAAAHVVLFVFLTAAWYWVSVKYVASNRALLLAVSLAVVFGVATELGQHFVNRGSMFVDLLANFLGIGLAVTGLGHLAKKIHPVPS